MTELIPPPPPPGHTLDTAPELGVIILLLLLCCLMSSDVGWHNYQGQAETNAKVWFNIALRPQKPESSLGRTAQDGHLDSHTAPELWVTDYLYCPMRRANLYPPSPAPHTWVHISTFLSSWQKLQLTSMNPLCVFSRFSRSKHNEFWSRHHCINSVTVQLLWPVISLVYNLQGGKLSTAKKIQLLQAPVASFVCAELFSVFRQLRSEFWHYIKINGYS